MKDVPYSFNDDEREAELQQATNKIYILAIDGRWERMWKIKLGVKLME
jgi:hypothetical protein